MSESRPQQPKIAPPPSSDRLGASSLTGPSEGLLVVGIGASAGGLDACRKLLASLPAGTGMAFILVQHLDPTHESMMVDLLASHTPLQVRQASDRMPLEREHLYVIPPGYYLSVADGALRLSPPKARHGARLPFDFLLHALAEAYRERAICVILSGTGADGSIGLKSVKEMGGLVIAQDPAEANFDGMPRSAIMTGAVDVVLPVGAIPDALVKYSRRSALTRTRNDASLPNPAKDWLPEVIDLLRIKTAHDFRLYKPGTLRRRIERRMAMTAIESDDIEGYLDFLRSGADEIELLARDLLINVTGFFRDPEVFEYLAETIVPELVRNQAPDRPIRIWTAGCSSGEETYSLAMLFREAIATGKRNIKLNVFASDVDSDAIARARDGLYPETIADDVTPARLARFFSKEEHGYRVLPELRETVVFTVHDVLTDPPFSRLDLISCRNLLIYLQAEAQAKVVSQFHFALRDGGVLLLGGSESIGNIGDRFAVLAKEQQLYRRIGRHQPGEIGLSRGDGDPAPLPARTGQGQPAPRQAPLAELCRRLVMEAYAPAAILINRRHECLYSLGPVERYLRVAPGHPTHDLLAMVGQELRTKLRSAIQQSVQQKARVVVAGGLIDHNAKPDSFSIAVQPVQNEGEDLLLVCFIDQPKQVAGRRPAVAPGKVRRVAELEGELEATRTELEGAIRDLEISGEEQRAINEESMSVSEEFQSTNEELLTSKEELQSLNEELTALNSQLQETLERQRTTSNDLQNILYSTNVATLFLDTNLNIRYFTPATKSLFSVIPGDIGRPLADLSSLAADGALLSDARAVLQGSEPLEREIRAQTGAWYVRRILPYRTHEKGVEGVVITFVDISERKLTAEALEAATRQADLANIAKSRFLAAASHDLRQPLQTIALLQGILARTVEGERAQKLVGRLDEALGAMSGMLNALLDINQIEAGTIRAEMADFPLADLLGRLRDEYRYSAEAQGLAFRGVSCRLAIHSDPRLLEQMLRNLLSNALKYTKGGKVLLGCRRRKAMLSIEVWDTGIGIPGSELKAIFDEYHQLDNEARERSRGLGLGLAIVQRLGNLLGHRVQVRSVPGKGSVFTIDVALASSEVQLPPARPDDGAKPAAAGGIGQTGTILIVEDDPEVRDLLGVLLGSEGHRIIAAKDGIAATRLPLHGADRPDLILADFNLPNGMNGLQLAAKLRETLHDELPVVILTGDISTSTLTEIARQNCLQLNKPVKVTDLSQIVQSLLAARRPAARPRPAPPQAAGAQAGPVIFVVDDDNLVREAIRSVLEEDGRRVEAYSSCEDFLAVYRPGGEACLLIDARLPGMDGLALLQQLQTTGDRLPAIMITGSGDVPTAVNAMKAGASDFIEKPFSRDEILAGVARALEQSSDASKLSAWRENAAHQVAGLTQRQRQIMDLVLAGHPSKNIAADLGISQRTVENHRASIMLKTGSKSLPALARLAVAAAEGKASRSSPGRGNGAPAGR